MGSLSSEIVCSRYLIRSAIPLTKPNFSQDNTQITKERDQAQEVSLILLKTHVQTDMYPLQLLVFVRASEQEAIKVWSSWVTCETTILISYLQNMNEATAKSDRLNGVLLQLYVACMKS